MGTMEVKDLPIAGQYFLPNDISLIITNKLTFEDNSEFIISGKIGKLEIISQETTIGKNCTITSDGIEEGSNAVNLNLYFGEANISGLVISARGQKGKTGEAGHKGARGRDGDLFHNGSKGHPGGKGGQGYQGGNGGKVNLVLKKKSTIGKLETKIIGGPGGEGGPGGKGGSGGKGSITKHGGHTGDQGPAGDKGSPGIDGSYKIMYVEEFTNFENTLE